MMKKVWLTEHGNGFKVLTLESEHPRDDHMRLQCTSMAFPANPTPEHPKRHTLAIGLLEQEDINGLAQCLDQYRTDKE